MQTVELVRASGDALARIFSRLLSDVGGRVKLCERDRRLASLASLMGCGGADAFRAELADALAGGLGGCAAHEAVMQSAAYLGMGRALPFVQAAAQVFAANGIAVPPAAGAFALSLTAEDIASIDAPYVPHAVVGAL